MKNSSKFGQKILLGASSIAILIAGTSAFAQEQKEKSQEIVVVTGSRLQGKIERAVSPIAIIDKEKLLENAVVDIDDLLKKENQFASSIGSTSTPASTDAQGASTLDMRGMGQNRTLVLINGTRATPFGFRNSVDINTIPSTLIKRIEYLTGGASAVYGADAVAGVANFILNDKFDGLEVTANAGAAEEGDATQYAVGLTGGKNFHNGKGNITAYVGYAERGSLKRIDRDWAAIEYIDNSATGKIDLVRLTTTSRGGNFTRTGGGNVFNLSSVGGPTNNASFNFNNDGALVASAFSDSLTSYESFINPQDRVNLALFANYEVNDKLKFWARVTSSEIHNTGSFTFSNPSGTVGTPILIRKDNPYVTSQLASVFASAWNLKFDGTAGGTDAFKAAVTRSLVEFGPRTDENTRVSNQIAFGLKGQLTDNLRWDFSIIHGHSDEDTLRYGEGSPARLAQAANARLVSGVAQCVDTSNNCVPINLFGPNSITSAAANWVMGDPLQFGRNRDQDVISANFYGDTSKFFNFKGGPIDWSLGFEYRFEYGDMYWDSRILAGDYFGGTRRQNGFAKFDLAEVYTEIRAPLLSDLPFIKRFEFEGAYRHSVHSQAGGYDNSKLGFNWQIDDSLRVRGSQQTVFRAPNIGELWGVVGASVLTRSVGNVNDICTNPATTGADAATCLATGAPAAPYTQVTNQTFNAPFGGDPNMKPETGETYTIGFVWQPKFISGLSVMADYWNIQLSDAIGGLTATATVNLCYAVSKDKNSVYCQRIKRDSAGQISEVSLVDINVSNFETSGVDFSVRYSMKLPEFIPGQRIDWSLTGGWLENFVKQATPLEAKVNCVGKFGVAGSCSDSGVGSRPMPEWRGSLSASWVINPVTVRFAWRYFGEVDEGASATGTFTSNFIKHIDAQSYYDLAVSWRINDRLRASLSILNLEDKDPPMLGSAQFDANTIPSVYDVVGRRYGLGLVYKF